MSKIIGILGGMGPLATVDLVNKIIMNTPAKVDQDHLRMIIYNNPKIPSRNEAILFNGKNPLPELIKTAKMIEYAGADFIIMPCNTAHNWYHEVKSHVKIPFYDMIENTVCEIMNSNIPLNSVLLLATEAMITRGLYQKAFQSLGAHIWIPNPLEQEVISKGIGKVKALQVDSNSYIDQINEMIGSYKVKGIQAIIGGCTEIPLLFPYLDQQIIKIDPTLILAKLAIRKAIA
ncbi:aspartate/glutamate racemase family protein [Ammoniphilus sp. 3BR4]|uniref:aspartate/glutamate racemase family protein n=1 Tax=Ammoniphilus sp. 3BR4 TaxID=3158265 RepID=UPI003465BC43